MKETWKCVNISVKVIIPVALDLFGIWKQLAQGLTGFMGGQVQ